MIQAVWTSLNNEALGKEIETLSLTAVSPTEIRGTCVFKKAQKFEADTGDRFNLHDGSTFWVMVMP
jgi:hypothetical protein